MIRYYLMKLIVIFMLLYVMVLTTCNAKPSYRKISARDAYQMMQDTEEYILLDVRTGSEYKEEHIFGAVLIPDYEIENRAATELPDKKALILIYCRSGRRSANVAKELIKLGYTNVYDFGGIIDWHYDTVRESSI